MNSGTLVITGSNFENNYSGGGGNGGSGGGGGASTTAGEAGGNAGSGGNGGGGGYGGAIYSMADTTLKRVYSTVTLPEMADWLVLADLVAQALQGMREIRLLPGEMVAMAESAEEAWEVVLGVRYTHI